MPVRETAQDRRDREQARKAMLVQDLRDEAMMLVQRSKLSYERIHQKGGPTAATLLKWQRKEVRLPQLATIRTLLNAIGYDLSIGRIGSIQKQRFRG